MLAAFVLTLPIEDYLPYLPADGNMIAYGPVSYTHLAGRRVCDGSFLFTKAGG